MKLVTKKNEGTGHGSGEGHGSGAVGGGRAGDGGGRRRTDTYALDDAGGGGAGGAPPGGRRAGDVARETWAMRHGAAFLAPGYVLIAELSSQGGSTADDYTEEKQRGGNKKVSFTRTVDHPELDQMASKTLAGARYILATHSARFVSGNYFVGLNDFEKLDRQLDEGRKNAALCNKMSRAVKSSRVTIVDIYKLPLDVEDKRTALRVGASIYERLQTLRDAYVGDTRRTFQTAMVACTNLDMLVTGWQREIIRLALRSADSQRPLMIAHYGGRKVGRLDAAALERGRRGDFDYGPIDTAIEVFAPAAEALARGGRP